MPKFSRTQKFTKANIANVPQDKDINKLLQESTILTAEKAKEIGLVHEILEKFPLAKQTP